MNLFISFKEFAFNSELSSVEYLYLEDLLQNAGVMGYSTVCITGSTLPTLTLSFQDNFNIISYHLS